MRHLPGRRVFRFLAFLFVTAPSVIFAESAGSPSSVAPGWGSTWLEPANEQARQWQEFIRKIHAARQAHDNRAEVVLCDQLVASIPNSPGPYMVRASTRGRLKQFEAALADLAHAQKIADAEKRSDASSNILMVRATVREHQRDYRAAIDDLRASLKLNDQNEGAWNALARLRATAPDATCRDGAESVRLARKAVALANKSAYGPTDTLAAAYAEANDYPRAVETERLAMAAAGREIRDTARAQNFQKAAAGRLHLYEQHQAYHADLP